MLGALAQYGFPGLICSILFYILFRIVDKHEKERKDWYDRSDRNAEKMTEALNNNTSVISEMKGLIQGRH